MMSGDSSFLSQPMMPPSGPALYHNLNNTHDILDDRSFIQRIQNMDTPKLLRYMRLTNIGLALFQVLVGLTGLFNIFFLNNTSFLIALYVVLFGLLLLAFECRLTSMEPAIRRDFGFLFTYKGRTAFILFIGCMNFGMADSMAQLAGMAMCANAVFNCIVMLRHPDFTSGRMSSCMDPTMGYRTAEDETYTWLHDNPDLAAKASTYALAQASQPYVSPIPVLSDRRPLDHSAASLKGFSFSSSSPSVLPYGVCGVVEPYQHLRPAAA